MTDENTTIGWQVVVGDDSPGDRVLHGTITPASAGRDVERLVDLLHVPLDLLDRVAES
ncbi:MAG: hypothetical protein AB7N61_14905 [Acidimicrobiia bacterium]